MELVEVISSNIKRIGYDEKKLIVENGVVNETILNVYLEGTQVDLAGQVC